MLQVPRGRIRQDLEPVDGSDRGTAEWAHWSFGESRHTHRGGWMFIR